MTQDDVDIIAREAAYDGYFRIERFRLRHRLHAGGWSRPLMRELFERGHVAGLLPYDPDRDEVVLIEQFRVGALAAGRNPWLHEVVAGIIEEGESADAVARRETGEETGLEVDALVPICRYLSSPGGCSETVALYCGRVDASGAGGIHGCDDEGEDIRAFAVPFAEIESRLTATGMDDAPLANAMTLIALHWLIRNRDMLRQRWCT